MFVTTTWVFGLVVILLPKKPYSSMRVWVQSLGFSNIRVCEFRLEFLSYRKKKVCSLLSRVSAELNLQLMT